MTVSNLVAYITYTHIDEDAFMATKLFVCVENEPWVFYRGAEYFFASQPFPWDSVSFACKMMGADLLSIHSKDELDFIKERMVKVSCSDINTDKHTHTYK